MKQRGGEESRDTKSKEFQPRRGATTPRLQAAND